MWQANHVSASLRAACPDLAIELVEIQTEGDQIRDVPLIVLGGEGVFTRAIQLALLDGRVDIAVHSLKDLPTVVVPELTLAAVPPRGSRGDVLVARRKCTFAELPPGARVATSSLRRRAQLIHRRPDLALSDIRGNVETRLRKLAESDLEGIILAQAGLERLGLAERITEVLDPNWMYPAVGQGALGLECRTSDVATQQILARIDHPPTRYVVLAERAMLRTLGGGCQVPIGAFSQTHAGILHLRGTVLSPDGKHRIDQEIIGPLDANSETLGQKLADELLKAGANELLKQG